jgi:hypothetical protein
VKSSQEIINQNGFDLCNEIFLFALLLCLVFLIRFVPLLTEEQFLLLVYPMYL